MKTTSLPVTTVAALAWFAAGIIGATAQSPSQAAAGERAEMTDPRPGSSDRSELQWWKGNLHTHTLWSDGDSYPELVVDWYKEHGYDFLALSDHNVLSEGQKWVHPTRSRFTRGRGEETLARYIERFGEDWVETRTVDEAFLEELDRLPATGGAGARRPPEEHLELGEELVRLKPLNEFRHLFEEPGRFMMIQSEEISAAFTVHVNATNLINYIPPERGEDVVETMELNAAAVYKQRERTGQPMFPHINHPNFRWAITGEQLAQVENTRFFEVYNGHPGVNNLGDEFHVDLDRMWDIVLTLRLAELDLGMMFGLAVDDAHEYGPEGYRHSLPGRGWVMVRSAFLTPEHLIAALEAGEFYSTTGVTLKNFSFDGDRYEIEIDPAENVTYRTKFIGTREGYDDSREPVRDEDGEALDVTQRYSDEVGEVLAVVEGTNPVYEIAGDELYVRAKIISDRPKENPYSPDEKWEVAWTQPVLPGGDH